MRLIDADRLKEYFDQTCTLGGVLGEAIQKIIVWAKVVVDNAPTEQQWIHLTEKHPAELEEVFITWFKVNHAPKLHFAFIDKLYTGAAVYCNGRWYWYSKRCKTNCMKYGYSPYDEIEKDIEVVAWMKFPEPYKE